MSADTSVWFLVGSLALGIGLLCVLAWYVIRGWALMSPDTDRPEERDDR